MKSIQGCLVKFKGCQGNIYKDVLKTLQGCQGNIYNDVLKYLITRMSRKNLQGYPEIFTKISRKYFQECQGNIYKNVQKYVKDV